MAKKKITISDMIDRFGRERIVKALTKRRFTNKKRSEMRKTGQKHMGFKKGGATEPKYSVKQEVKDKMKNNGVKQKEIEDRMSDFDKIPDEIILVFICKHLVNMVQKCKDKSEIRRNDAYYSSRICAAICFLCLD